VEAAGSDFVVDDGSEIGGGPGSGGGLPTVGGDVCAAAANTITKESTAAKGKLVIRMKTSLRMLVRLLYPDLKEYPPVLALVTVLGATQH
jgi:hypothetical protein